MRHLLILLIIGIALSGYSQRKSKLVCVMYDEFENEEYLITKNIFYYEDYGDKITEGFMLDVFLQRDKGKIIPHTINVDFLNMEDSVCVKEGSTLDVIFENGEKITLRNWNDDNCEGLNYFKIGKNEFLFKSSKVKGFRYTNISDGNVIEVKQNMDEKNKTYIMNLLLEIDKINSGKLKLSECEVDDEGYITNLYKKNEFK
jgi:hypothetical protein